MADQNPPPGYGEQPPPGYPGGSGEPGGYGGQPPGYGGPPPGYGGPPGYGPGYGGQPSNTPLVLSIIGIVCWFVCSPAAIVLGVIAQSQFRNQGRPDTIAKVAWIGGIVALLFGIIWIAAVRGSS